MRILSLRADAPLEGADIARMRLQEFPNRTEDGKIQGDRAIGGKFLNKATNPLRRILFGYPRLLATVA